MAARKKQVASPALAPSVDWLAEADGAGIAVANEDRAWWRG